MTRLKPLVMLLPLLLWGCILTPGKFVSTLDIRADRSFAFTYVGDVWAVDLGNFKGLMDKGTKKAAKSGSEDEPEESSVEIENKRAAIAAALSKEAGYRKAEYLGDGRFAIDYAISGRLTHGFVYPFNADAEAVLPFIAIELRGKDGVRVKAPGFAAGTGSGGGSKAMPGGDKLDGVFTLTTDADVVSQNNEAGATTGPAGKTIVWKASPVTKDPPMAVLRVAALP